MYQVNETAGTGIVRLVLLGETSNTIAVTVRTIDQEAQCKLGITSHLVLNVVNLQARIEVAQSSSMIFIPSLLFQPLVITSR